MLRLSHALLCLATCSYAAPLWSNYSKEAHWQEYADDLLTEVMAFMDPFYDPYAGYLIDADINNGFAALYHATRESSWYAAGLLARNEGDDVVQAIKIIDNIISKQFLNTSDQWYGDYQIFPEEPTVGTAAYPATIYDTWDPNWREFIGTTFVMIVEEFSDLLPAPFVEKIVDSLLICAKGDTYRVGGVDGDNFYPAYSNPTIMSAAYAGWVGMHTGDANITAYGAKLASEVIALYDNFDTLSEFNCPTYAGVSLWGLTLWAKYFPSNTTQGQNGPRLITGIWERIGKMYNANLKNMAGPWDRTYGWDMNRYVAITSLWIWGLIGKDLAPTYKTPGDMAHISDFQFAILNSVVGPFHNKFVSQDTIAALTAFPGEHTEHAQLLSPPFDLVPRNVTTWLSDKLTIGMETFHQNVIGGASTAPTSFSPAVVQWLRPDGFIGFMSLVPEQYELQGEVSANSLSLVYPLGNDTSSFTFFVSPNGLQAPHDLYSLYDLIGINITVVGGTVNPEPAIEYCGAEGGACTPVDLFELWNFTYTMPAGSTEIPSIEFSINLTV